MKYIYAILLYLSIFIAVGAGAYVLIFNSPEFLISEMLPAIIVAGAGLVLAIVLLALMKICYAPDARVYSRFGFVSGVIGLIIQAVTRQFYSIHGALFFFEYIKVVTFGGVDLLFFILLAVTAAVNGYVILLSLCEYTTNRSDYLSEYNTPVALLAVLSSALGLATAFSSVALLFPVFTAVWRYLHTANYGDAERDKKEKKLAFISPIVTVALAVLLFIMPFNLGRGRFIFEYEDLNDEYCKVTVSGASGGVSELAVPSEEGGKKVGSVSFKEGFEDLEYLYLPSTVFEVSITTSKMPDLKAIEVEEGNEYFKTIDGALYDILGQKLIALPSTVTDYTVPDGVTNIGFGLNKDTVKRITYNNDITDPQPHIGYTALEYVSLGEGVTKIPNKMFFECNALKTVEIRGAVTEIGDEAFGECYALTGFKFPETLTKIGNTAFLRCSALTELPLNEGLLTVGESAFASCRGLTSVTIPSTVEALPDNAFLACESLASVDLGGVTAFEENTFNMTAIKTLHLPAAFKGSITKRYVFPASFEGFEVDEANERYLAYDGVLYEKKYAYPIVYKAASKTELNLYDGCYSIPDPMPDVTKLKLSSAFTSTSGLNNLFPNLVELTLGSGIRYFHKDNMPDTLAYVSVEEHKYLEAENGVLFNCHYLSTVSGSVYIPPMMTNVILPDKLQIINGAIKELKVDEDMDGYSVKGEKELFNGERVESLTLGSALREINLARESGSEKLNNDTVIYSRLAHLGLKRLVFKGSDTKVAAWSFSNCTELSEVIFEAEDKSGSMTFGMGTFYNCKSLSLQTLPDWLTEVDSYAFLGTLGKTFSFGGRLVKLENSAMPDSCEWVSMRADNDVLYNMNGIIACKESVQLVIPRRIKRVIFTPSSFDLPKMLLPLTSGIRYFTELEYVELSEGASFDTPVVDGVVYSRNAVNYSVMIPLKLKKFVVPKLDMPLHFDYYSSYYTFDEIALGEGVTEYKLVKGCLYTADGKNLLASGKQADGKIYLSDEMTGYEGGAYSIYTPSLYLGEGETVVFGSSLDQKNTTEILQSLANLDRSNRAFIYSAYTAAGGGFSDSVLEEIYEKVDVYIYSEAKPKPTDTGKYWHYDANGNAVIWVVE